MILDEYKLEGKSYPIAGIIIYDHVKHPMFLTCSLTFLKEIDILEKLLVENSNQLIPVIFLMN